MPHELSTKLLDANLAYVKYPSNRMGNSIVDLAGYTITRI